MATKDYAAESGHWYRKDGTPCYTLIGKNGNERAVTLRDARTMGLLPSVTSIIRLAAAPALQVWMQKQVLLSAMTLPRNEGETDDAWMDRVMQDSREEGKQAAERGTLIHAAIEQHYSKRPIEPEFALWVNAAAIAIEAACGPQEWSSERSFGCAAGYGGKTDLTSPNWVIDVKTKDGDGAELYPDHWMQLAAYRDGLGLPNARCGILFVNRREPQATFAEVKEEDLAKGGAMFSALLAFHQAKNQYKP